MGGGDSQDVNSDRELGGGELPHDTLARLDALIARQEQFARREAVRDEHFWEQYGAISAALNPAAKPSTTATATVNSDATASRVVWYAWAVVVVVPICALWAVDHAGMEARAAQAERRADMRELNQLRDDLRHAEQRIDVQQIQIDKVMRANKL